MSLFTAGYDFTEVELVSFEPRIWSFSVRGYLIGISEVIGTQNYVLSPGKWRYLFATSSRFSWVSMARLQSRVVFWWLEFFLEPSITSMKIIFVFFCRYETNAFGNELILDKWQTVFLLTCRTVTVNLLETDCSTTLSFKKIRFSISNWNFCHAWRRGMVIWAIWLAVPSPRFCNFDHHTNLFANDIISFRDNNLDL